MDNSIENPTDFFAELGGLHDADIGRITWNAEARSIEIEIDDLSANFDGLPGYSDKRPVVLKFNGLEELELRCDGLSADTQRIYRLEVRNNPDSRQASALILILPSGRLSFEFANIAVRG